MVARFFGFGPLIFLLAFSSFGLAAQGPQSFTLDGYVKEAGTTTALKDSALKIKIQIMDPTKHCLLYEEEQTVDTLSSEGYFSIQVGSDIGAAKRTADDSGLAMYQVFQNSTAVVAKDVPGQTCTGGTFTPITQDFRYMRVTVTPSGTGVADVLSPDTVMDAVPAAVIAEWAESVGGFTPNDLLQVNAGDNLTQTNLENLFAGTGLSNLQAIAAGNFMPKSSTAGATLPSYATGTPPITPVAGSMWYDSGTKEIKYYDGSATQIVGTGGGSVTEVKTTTNLTVDGVAGGTITSSGTLDLSNTGVTANTYPKVTVDAKGRVTAGTTLAETDIPTLTTAGKVSGDTITSGTIGGSTVINTTGNITTTGTITAPTFSSTAMSTRQLDIYDADTNRARIVTPNDLAANYDLTLPADDGGAGQVLSTNGTGTLSWIDALTDVTGYVDGGNTFGADASIGLKDNFRLDIKTNDTPRITVAADGKIGIGTTDPKSNLDVNGGLRATGSIAPASGSGIELSYWGAQGNVTAMDRTTPALLPLNLSGKAIYFGTGPAAGYFNHMMIDSDGKVRIGTGLAAPDTLLDVEGTIKVGDGGETCAATYAGGIRYNGGNLQFCNGTAWATLGVAGSGITALTGDVTTSGSGSVTATIANDAVTSAKILDGTIATGDLANDAVTSAKIKDGEVATGDLADDAVTFVKIQDMNTNRILGRSTTGTGDVEEIALGTGLTLSGGTLDVSDGTDNDALGSLSCNADEVPKWNGTAWVCEPIAALGSGDFKKDGSVAMTGTFKAADGTVSLPSITFNSDQDNGLFLAAPDEVAIATGGTDRLHIDDVGNIGVGVSVPTSFFHIQKNHNNSTRLKVGNSDSGISASAGISIDASSAQGQLVTYGSNYTSSGGPSAPGSTMLSNDTPSGLSLVSSSSTGRLRFFTGGLNVSDERIRINSTGLVGIGTTNPRTRLDVTGTIKVGDGGETCAATYAGGIRYNGGNLQFCNGTAWSTLGVAGSGITALTGDVTALGTGSVAATIANDAVTSAKIKDGEVATDDLADGAVTFAKIQDLNPSVLIGRAGLTSGPAQEITWGAGLTMTGTVLDVTDTTDDDALGGLTCTANEVPAWDGTNWVCQPMASASTVGALVLRDGTGNFAANTITANGLSINNAGSLVNIASPLGANYSLSLPADDGDADQVLTTDGDGILTWTTPLTSSTGYKNGGNSFGADATIGLNDNNRLDIKTNNQPRVTVAANGNVGIGETAPLFKFVVEDTDFQFGIQNGLDAWGLTNWGSSLIFQYGYNDAQPENKMRLTTDGYLQLGEWSSASQMLSIGGNGDDVGANFQSTSDTNFPYLTGTRSRGDWTTPTAVHSEDILLSLDASGYDGSAYSNQVGIDYRSSQDWTTSKKGTEITFSTTPNDSTSRTDVMLLSNAGNLGVGNTDPKTRLDVTGTLKVGDGGETCGATYAGGIRYNGGALQFCNGTAWTTLGTGSGSGDFKADGSVAMTGAFKAADGTTALPGVAFASDAGNGIALPSADTLTISTNGSERIRVTPSGHVGIGGVDPSSFPLWVRKNQNASSTFYFNNANSGVSASARIVAAGDATNTSIIQYSSTSGSVGISGPNAGALSGGGPAFSLSSAGILKFFTNGVTDVDERMRIDVTGNVGIGTTDPNYLLDVDGIANATQLCIAGDCKSAWPAAGGSGDFKADGTVPMTGQFLATNGTTGAPGISFAGDPDTGIRNGSSGYLQFSTNGVNNMQLSSGYLAVYGKLGSNVGSAAAPTHTFNGDQDTGMWSPDDDTLAWSTSGTEKMRIASNGSVGIGTTDPTDSLMVIGSANGSGAGHILVQNTFNGGVAWGGFEALNHAGVNMTVGISADTYTGKPYIPGGAAFLGSPSWTGLSIGAESVNGDIRFATGGIAAANQRMIINKTGKVGIGTTAPGSLLTVEGNVALGNSSTATGPAAVSIGNGNSATQSSSVAIGFGNTTSGTRSVTLGAQSTASGQYSVAIGRGAFVSADDAVSIGRTVRVGSGTAGDGTGQYSIAFGAGLATGTYPKITGNNSFGFFMGDQSGVTVSANNVMAIMGGSVGIGTTAPSEALEVSGNVKATSFISTSDARLKRDIATVDGLAAVEKLRGVTWNWKADGTRDMGVIAQEVEKVFPWAVVTDPSTGYKAVKYNGLIAPMIEATKEIVGVCEANAQQLTLLQEELNAHAEHLSAHDREIASLKEENARLKKELDLIKKKLGM